MAEEIGFIHFASNPTTFNLAEEVGFEPTVLSHNGFQDRRLKPLGHSSVKAAQPPICTFPPI